MSQHKFVNGVRVDLTQEEIDAIETAQAEENVAYNSIKYKDDRRNAYPSIEDQLDKIFHNGIDAWKSEIQAIKDDNPKP